MEPMTKYVRVAFVKYEAHEVIAKVESDLSGRELEEAVAVPVDWMDLFFGKDGRWPLGNRRHNRDQSGRGDAVPEGSRY